VPICQHPSMNRLAAPLLAACLIGCTGHASILTGEHHAASLFLLDPTDISDTFDYASLNIDPFPPQSRYFYRDGKSVGRAQLVSSADPEFGDDMKVSFSPKIDIAPGTLIADRDINLRGRYEARPATRAEHADLIRLEGSIESPSTPSMPGDGARRSEILTIVTDRSGQRGDVAVHSSETYSLDANGETTLRSFLGIYVRSPSGQWRVDHTESRTGCDGCESQPTSWSLVGFGDVCGAGELTLLFTELAYETWGMSGYELNRAGKGSWLSPDMKHE